MIDFLEAHKETYIPIVGGGSKHRNSLGNWARENCLADDTYEGNISHLNKRVNEVTVLHTLLNDILPKTNADWCGICHYRRFFPDSAIDKLTSSDMDMMVMPSIPMVSLGRRVDIEVQYAICHFIEDFYILKDALIECN